MIGIFGLVGFGANVNLLGWCDRHLPDKLAGWVGYSVILGNLLLIVYLASKFGLDEW